MNEAAFYCVADSSYFLGLAGMLNSLRLLGHNEPVYVLDCGLSPDQRERLSAEATIVPGPDEVPPCLLKTVAPLRERAKAMVMIDADIIVTRSLAELLERAAVGRVVAFKDDQDRYFPEEWRQVLGRAVPDRLPYVSSSLVVLGGDAGHMVAQAMDELQPKLDIDGSPFATRVPDREFFRGDIETVAAGHPFVYPEQDLLNAILAARLNPDQVDVLDRRLEATPPFDGVRVLDEATLRCAYDDGAEPYALHHYAVKPWLERTHDGPYSRLLRRLLARDDVAIRLPKGQVPLRLRRGPAAYAERKCINARERLRWRLEGS